MRDLKKYFDSSQYSGLGLNVFPPVYQGINLKEAMRLNFVTRLATSPYPDIQKWPKSRAQRMRDGSSESDGKRKISLDDPEIDDWEDIIDFYARFLYKVKGKY